MQKIGKYQIKRPKFILFLDKDGTTDLEDKNLNNIFHLVTKMEGMVIFVTGRTVGDIKEELKSKKVEVPPIIAGDNGAVICYTKTNETFKQKELGHEKVMEIINSFICNGGNKDYIRFTNGMEIFASKDKDVKKYYRKNKTVNFCDDVCSAVQGEKHITKLVLSGSKDLMDKSKDFINGLDYWTDMDVTAFPKKECQNYRLDIAQKDINKGDAVREIVKMLDPQYGYMCVGNGFNDMSMFKVAIDDGMRVAIMKQSSQGLFEELKQYAKGKKGRVELVPCDKNLANKYILKKAKCFQTYIRTKERNAKRNNRLPNVPRVKVNGVYDKNMSFGSNWKMRNRDR